MLCLISSVTYTYGQEDRKLIDRMIDTIDNQRITHFEFNDTTQINVLEFRNYLKALRRQDEINNKVKGKFTFAFKIQNSDNKDLSEFLVGVDFRKGIFPGEINFETNVDIRFENGELVENLSNLFLAYDYHFFNSLKFEGYGFLRRTSNDYLNIERRYETGTGIVWNVLYSGQSYNQGTKEGHRLTKDGKKQHNRLENTKDEVKSMLGSENVWSCNEKGCKKFDFGNSAFDDIEKSYAKNKNAIIKDQSGFRLSFLAGLNYEVETTQDSLKLFPDDEGYKQSYEAKKLFRLALAPILSIQIGQLEFYSRFYYKVGIFNNDNTSKVYSEDGTEVDIKNDFRIEWPTHVTFKFTEKVSLKGLFYYVYISAPNRSFINVANDPVNNPPEYELFQAANKFFMTRLGLEFKL